MEIENRTSCMRGGLRARILRGGALPVSAALLVAALVWVHCGCVGAPIPPLNFAASIVEGNAPLAVGFASSAPESTTSWHWQFGDGASSDEESPTHTYASPGVYTVRLRVTLPLRDGGERTITKTKQDYITVGPRRLYVGHAPGHELGDNSPDQISVINAVGGALMTKVHVDQDPFAFALRGGKVYVVCYRANDEKGSLYIVDAATNTIVEGGIVPVGCHPRAIAITWNKAYVVNYGDGETNGSVSVIDIDSHIVTRTIDVGVGPRAIAISRNRAYVVNYNEKGEQGSVTVISTLNDRVLTVIPVGRNPRNIAIGGKRAYVVNYNEDEATGSVTVIDTLENEVIDEVDVGQHPRDIAISGKWAYVVNFGPKAGNAGGSVSVINTRTLAVWDIPMGVFPWSVLIHGNRAYVPNYEGTVLVISTGAKEVIDTIDAGVGPVAIAISGSRAYVVNYGIDYDENGNPIGTISVFLIATDELLAPILVDRGPARIIVVP